MTEEGREGLKYNPKREGFIGDVTEGQAEILFVLKEPHDKNNEEKFWFKNDIYQPKKESNRYYNLFRILADKLIDGDESAHEKLGKCAFMNIYPFSGGATASKNYKNMKKADIFYRVTSCLEAIEPKKIVCCMDAYNKVVNCFGSKEEEKGLQFTDRDRSFSKCKVALGKKEIEVFEFYHPSARGTKFTKENVCFADNE